MPAWLKKLDELTIEEWQPSSGPLSRTTREAFHASLRAVLSIEPSEASFLFLLHYAATAGGYSQLIDAAGSGAGAEDRRFVRGTKALVDGFAGAVGAESIVTGEKVLHVESGARHVDVTTASGKVYRGDRVIAAIGPWAFRKRPGHNTPIELDFDFRGPAGEAERHAWNERRRLCDGTHHGLSLKCFLRFEKPFWREAGLSGRSLCVGAEGQPISWTIDDSYEPPAGASGPPQQYSLMAFIAGQPAHELATWEPDARRNAVLAQLEELFGALPPVLDYRDHVKAGPAGVMERGVLSTVGSALRRPIGRVHFASSESALDWCGYMDGAIQSGLRAGAEVP